MATSGPLKLTLDTDGPVISGTENIIIEAVSSFGAVANYTLSSTVANYTLSAIDSVSGSALVTCTPASGWLFPLGITNVVCTATDYFGNTATAAFTVTVVDTTAPAISPIFPVNDTTMTNTLPDFNWTSTDAVSAVSCTLYLDDAIVASGIFPTSGSAYGKTAASAIAIGSHIWYVKCIDAAGNTANTPARVFTITAPAPAPAAPAAGNGPTNGGGNVFIPAPTIAPIMAPAPAGEAAPVETPAPTPLPLAAPAATATVATAPRLEIPAPAAQEAATPAAAAALFGGIEFPQLAVPALILAFVLTAGLVGFLVFRYKK
ncbi:MAG: HYR domain-containing protein [Candidatus Micrarchaeota archaeon]|nr:HYR domain-containing protein [Candidatus Micrarchaeota archaeon]